METGEDRDDGCSGEIGARGEHTDGGRSLSIGIHYLDTLFLGV